MARNAGKNSRNKLARLVLALAAAGAASGVSLEQARAADEARPGTTETVELNLSVGENKTLPARGVKSYSEGAPGVMEVRLTPEGNEFVIVGQKPGSTTLLLIMNNRQQILYTVNVFARSMEAVENELKQLLSGNTGIRIRRVGPRLFIEGGVNNEHELERIKHIAALYPGQVESLVVVGGVAADRKHNIQLDVYFVQLNRQKGYGVGVSWPARIGPAQASVSYDLLAGRYINGSASVVSQTLLGLDLAASKGWAKVLKHSTVITANGAKANFSSGGEQNFQVVTSTTIGVQSLTFGTNVEVLPRFDPTSGELEIKVDAKVSDLTPPASSPLPGRETTELGTLVQLKLGQGLILSGIQTKTQRHSVGGVPLLSEIPVLGVLFGRHTDEQEEVEGAIVMVPSVVESIPKRNAELLSEMVTLYEDFPSEEPLRKLRGQWRERSEWKDTAPSPPVESAPRPERSDRSGRSR